MSLKLLGSDKIGVQGVNVAQLGVDEVLEELPSRHCKIVNKLDARVDQLVAEPAILLHLRCWDGLGNGYELSLDQLETVLTRALEPANNFLHKQFKGALRKEEARPGTRGVSDECADILAVEDLLDTDCVKHLGEDALEYVGDTGTTI